MIENRFVIRIALLLILLTSLLMNNGLPAHARVELAEGTVVVSEFFEEVHLLDLTTGDFTDALDSNPFDAPFGQLIEVFNKDSVALTSFRELHRYDVASKTTSLVKELSFSPAEITRDRTGNLVAVGTSGVVRIDAMTGAETLIYDETFFAPRDAVVDDQGNIFVTEFFNALGVVNPRTGTFEKIGDFRASQFGHIDLGIDGLLYLSSTSGGNFYQVNPYTGSAKLLAAEPLAIVDELQIAPDGSLLFGGRLDSVEGIFSLDPTTGSFLTVVNGDALNGGFFNLLDFDVYESGLRFSVPEPSTLRIFLIGCCALPWGVRRNRA